MKYLRVGLAVIVIGILMSNIGFAEPIKCTTLSEVNGVLEKAVDDMQTTVDIETPDTTEFSSFHTSVFSAPFGTPEYGVMESQNGIKTTIQTINHQNGRILLHNEITYWMTVEQRNELDKSIQGWIRDNVSSDMPESLKVLLISKHIAEGLKYADFSQDDNAYRAYSSKVASSIGYANLASRYFDAAGIDNCIVIGVKPPLVNGYLFLENGLDSEQLMTYSNFYRQNPQSLIYEWNMVKVDNEWFHFDLPNFDGQFSCPRDDGKLFPEHIFLSSFEMGFYNLWLNEKYPTAPRTWWEGQSPVQMFDKKYLEFTLYDYPLIQGMGTFDAYCRDAMEKGVKRQAFRHPASSGFYGALKTPQGERGNVTYSRLDNRRYSYDKLETDFKYNTEVPETDLTLYKTNLSVEIGDRISFADISGFKNAMPEDVKWYTLSQATLKKDGDSIVAQKSGVGYLALESKFHGSVVRVTVSEAKPKIVLNGKRIEGIEPLIINGKTYVPMRSLFEALGTQVTYIPEKREINGTRGTLTLSLSLDRPEALLNGTKTAMDAPLKVISGQAYVPVRFVAKSLGDDVQWDDLRKAVLIVDASLME